MNYRRGQFFSKGLSASCIRFMNPKTLNSYTPMACLYQPLHTSQTLKASVIVPEREKPSIIKRILKKFGRLDHSRSKLKRSGYYLYENVADGINYLPFFEEFELEDSFFSWFLVTELHVWMVLVRVMAEAEEGRYVRNCIVEAMWTDVSNRCKKLDKFSSSDLSDQLAELSEQFQAAIVGYDEGLLSEDRVLAGAVWRRFFSKKCADPRKVEHLVRYIRKQVCTLDELPSEKVLQSPSIKWIPLGSLQETNVP